MAFDGSTPRTVRQRRRQTSLDLPLALPARALWVALALVLAVLFITDLRAPLGALDSIPYVLAVVLSLALPRGYEHIVVAAACTAITLVSAFFGPPDSSIRQPSLLHTGLPIFIVWVTAWMAHGYRRIGQAVLDADERIQLAANAAGFGTFDFDPAAGISRWSPGARRIVGIEEEAVRVDRIIEAIHPDDVERVHGVFRTCQDPRGSGDFEDEHRIRHPDGTERWVLLKGRTAFGGDGMQRHAIHLSGVIVDVTERRRAEEALRQSEEHLRVLTERFQTAFQSAPVVAFNQDRDLRYTWIYNPLLGNAVADLIGRRDTEIFERVEDAEATEAIKREVLRTGESRRGEVRLLQNGVERAYDLTVQPLRRADGEVNGITCAAIDITEVRQSEAALRSRNDRLRLLSTVASQLVLRGTAMQTGRSDEVLSKVFAHLAETVNAETHLHYRAEAPDRLRLISSSGLSEETRIKASSLRFGDSLCGSVAVTRTRWVLEDLQTSTAEEAVPMRAHGAQTYAGFPLITAGGRVVATASFATATRKRFDPDELALMQTVCDLVSAAVARDELDVSLQESEERLRLANEAAGIGTFDIDLLTRTTRCSPQLNAIAGIPPETITALDEFVGFLHAEDREPSLALFRAAAASEQDGTFGSEVRIVRRDGTVRWLAWSGRLFFGDRGRGRNPVRIIGAVLDITERRRAEDALANREALYRTLAEAMPHIVYTTSPEGVVDYVNSRWIEYTGIEAGESPVFDWTESIHPDDRERVRGAWQAALASGHAFAEPFRLLRIDGDYRWHASRALPVRNDAGGLALWIGTFTDMHDVTVATAALKDADRRKDEFLATLAHELRNPLSPMRIAVTLLGRHAPEDPELANLRQVIERQVDHLTRLVDDLLDVSRITRDRLTLRKEHVDLSTVIDAAIETARPEFERHGQRLTVEMAPGPLLADCDVVRITQVFSNLLNNAAKYTPEGGSIWVTADREGPAAVVRVRDTGIGISPEKLPRLFEMFYQADPTLDRPDGGLGIGLTLVHRLLEMHHGSVEAKSAGPGHGSEFVVRLPLLGAGVALRPASSQPPAAAASAAALRVLVVDDNRDSAEMLRALLEVCGNEVHTAYDGEEALAVAERARPDAVLLDIGLPRMNGYDVCRRLREQAWGRDLLIIAQTGWGQDQDRQRSQDAGFDAHLTKPVDDEVLLALLAGWQPGREVTSSDAAP